MLFNTLIFVHSQDWQDIQLLHVYQEQLVTGEEGDSATEAVVDLSSQQTFDENFFLVVLEKSNSSAPILHMWKLNIDSKPNTQCHPSKIKLIYSCIYRTMYIDDIL